VPAHFSKKLGAALVRLADAAECTDDLAACCAHIQQAVGELVPAQNFFIALHDPTRVGLVFPYFRNEHTPPPRRRGMRNGLVEYVLRSGRPFRLSARGALKLLEREGYWVPGVKPRDWVGIPLKRRNMTFGVVAVQSYSPALRYTEEDVQRLCKLAPQIARLVEERRSGASVHESEHTLQSLYSNCPIPMWVYDVKTLRFLDVNRAAVRQYGYSREEFLRMTIKDIRPPEDVPALLALVARLTHGVNRVGIWRHRRKDGTLFSVEITSHTLTFRGRLAEVVLAQDVTERIQAEQTSALLQQMLLAVGEADDFETSLSKLVELVCERTGWEIGEAWVPLPDGSGLGLRSTWKSGEGEVRRGKPLASRARIEPGEGLPGRIYTTRKPAWSKDVSREPYVESSRAESGLDFDLRGAFGLPIVSEKEVLAVLVFFTRFPRKQNQHLIDLVAAVAEKIGASVYRKKVEAELRRSEARYRAMVEYQEEAVCRWLPDTTLTYVNAGYCELFGKTKEELIGRKWVQVVPENVRQQVNDEIRDLQARPRIHMIEHEVVGPNGEVRWQNWVNCPLFDETGALVEFQSVGRDVTERKAAEEARHQAVVNEGLRAVLSAADELIACPDLETFYRRAVELARERLGLDRCGLLLVKGGEIHGTYGTDAKGASTDERGRRDPLANSGTWNEWLEQIKAGGRRWFLREVEQYAEFPEGRMRTFGSGGWVAFTPIFLDGELIALFCNDSAIRGEPVDETRQEILAAYCSYLGPVLKRIEIEEALRRSEERFRQIAENSREVFWMAKPDQKEIIYVSPGYEEIWGRSCRSLYENPTSWMNSIHLDDRERVADTIRGLRKERKHILEYRVVRPDGTVRWVQDRIFPVRDGAGQVYRIAGIAGDITERKTTEERVRSYQEQLRSLASELALAEERERRKIATQLHDRTIQTLALIKIKWGSMRSHFSSEREARLFEEIHALLDQAIQEGRSLTFDLSPPVLYDLGFKPAVEWLADQMAERHGLVCEVEAGDGSIPLDTETSVVLFQAVRELLVNIIKHAQASRAVIRLHLEAKNVRVEVEDDGTGLSIWDPPRGGRGSTGFGLFSIRERLTNIGGYFHIGAGNGRGTRAVLRAPLSLQDEVPGGVPIHGHTHSTGR